MWNVGINPFVVFVSWAYLFKLRCKVTKKNHKLCQFDLNFMLFYKSYSQKYDNLKYQIIMPINSRFIKKYNSTHSMISNPKNFHTFAVGELTKVI